MPMAPCDQVGFVRAHRYRRFVGEGDVPDRALRRVAPPMVLCHEQQFTILPHAKARTRKGEDDILRARTMKDWGRLNRGLRVLDTEPALYTIAALPL